MSSLLEEAIVDAKALKEAALKNAETAVLEKYAGEVKSALSTLLEQDDLGLEEDAATDPELTEFVDEVPYAFQNEDLDAPADQEIVEINFDSLKQRLEEEGEVVEGDDMIDATAMADEIALEEGDDEDSTFDRMAKDNDDAVTASAIAEGDEDEDIDLTEEMLAELVEELVVDMVPRPQGWSSINSANNSIEQANNDAMAAAMAVNEEEEELEEEVETAPDVVSDSALYEAQISDLKESTRELRALLIESKEQLTRLNLENAKLVYQNKALNSASLNERQKNQIAEAVQSANSVEEAAMIYETIQNAVGASADPRTRPQTLREAVQRPTSLLMNSKKNNTAPRDPKMDRMLRLAGLTKQ